MTQKGGGNVMEGMLLMCGILLVAVVVIAIVASKEGKNDILEQ